MTGEGKEEGRDEKGKKIWDMEEEYEGRGRRESERGMEKEDGLARREAGRKAMLMSWWGEGGGRV